MGEPTPTRQRNYVIAVITRFSRTFLWTKPQVSGQKTARSRNLEAWTCSSNLKWCPNFSMQLDGPRIGAHRNKQRWIETPLLPNCSYTVAFLSSSEIERRWFPARFFQGFPKFSSDPPIATPAPPSGGGCGASRRNALQNTGFGDNRLRQGSLAGGGWLCLDVSDMFQCCSGLMCLMFFLFQDILAVFRCVSFVILQGSADVSRFEGAWNCKGTTGPKKSDMMGLQCLPWMSGDMEETWRCASSPRCSRNLWTEIGNPFGTWRP